MPFAYSRFAQCQCNNADDKDKGVSSSSLASSASAASRAVLTAVLGPFSSLCEVEPGGFSAKELPWDMPSLYIDFALGVETKGGTLTRNFALHDAHLVCTVHPSAGQFNLKRRCLWQWAHVHWNIRCVVLPRLRPDVLRGSDEAAFGAKPTANAAQTAAAAISLPRATASSVGFAHTGAIGTNASAGIPPCTCDLGIFPEALCCDCCSICGLTELRTSADTECDSGGALAGCCFAEHAVDKAF